MDVRLIEVGKEWVLERRDSEEDNPQEDSPEDGKPRGEQLRGVWSDSEPPRRQRPKGD